MWPHLMLACLAASVALGQTQPTRIQFEVASVKAAPPLDTNNGVSYGRHIDGAQVRFVQTSLRELIRIAWRVRDYQIDAPAWLASARFDVTAKLPDGRPQEQVPEMLQALLADRFALKTHRASRDLPVYALVARGDGLAMKESPPDEADDLSPVNKPVEVKLAGGGGRGGIIDYGGGSYFALPHYRLEGRKLSMVLFADLLGYLTDRPVVNRTGLSARYDFTVDLSEEDYDTITIRAAISIGETQPPRDLLRLANGGDPLPSALRRLGLRFEQRKAPIEVLVVDDIHNTPTEN